MGDIIGVTPEPSAIIDLKNDFSLKGQLDLVIHPLKVAPLLLAINC